MESGPARTNSVDHATFDRHDRFIEQRLTRLLELNAETVRERSLYRTDRERREASLMTAPIDPRKAFSYFGLMLGTMPPFAVVLKIISETMPSDRLFGLAMLMLLAGMGTGIIGYATGRIVPFAVDYAAKLRQPSAFLLLPLIGFVWGGVSGAIGGFFLFVIGSVFAGIAGGVVGAFALPIFIALYSTVRRGELIEMKHFLPIAFGMTLTLCAFILGL